MTSSGAVLFLHGQPGSARDWAAVCDALSGDLEAIATDRPGWDGRGHATDLAGNASAAVAALDGHGVDRATVVGHSFGGAVAAWLAVHYSDRVTALVLAAPSANTRSLSFLDYLLAAPVAGPLLSAVTLAGAGVTLRSPVTSRLRLDSSYGKAVSRLLVAPSAWRSFVMEQRALVRELPVLEAKLGDISAPTVIVSGAADRVVPAAASRALAQQIPGADLVELRRAGHLLPHRHAELLAEIIARVAVVRSR